MSVSVLLVIVCTPTHCTGLVPYILLPVYGPNFSEVSHSGSAVEHGIASKSVFVDVNTESAAILKCTSIEVHDE